MAKCELRDEFTASEIRGLILDIGYASLIVEEADTDKVIVSTVRDEEKNSSYLCELKDGMLRVKTGNVNITISLFGDDKTFHKGDIEKDTVTITVPVGMCFSELELSIGAGNAKLLNDTTVYEHVEIEVGAGKLQMNVLNVDGHVDLEVGAGSAEIKTFKAKTADFECGVGRMNISGSVDGNINVNCGVGSIEMYLDAVESDYNYDISCAVGSVMINGSKRGGMFASASRVCSPSAKGNIALSCGVGKIELNTQKRVCAM